MCASLLAPVGEPVVRLELDPRGREEIERRRRRELLAPHQPLADLARVRLGEISRHAAGHALPSGTLRAKRVLARPHVGVAQVVVRAVGGSEAALGVRRGGKRHAGRPTGVARGSRVRQVLSAQLIAQRDQVEQPEDEGQLVPGSAAVHPRESADQCALENRWSAQCRLRSRRAPVPQLDLPWSQWICPHLSEATGARAIIPARLRAWDRVARRRERTRPRAVAAIRCAVGSALTSLRAGADLGGRSRAAKHSRPPMPRATSTAVETLREATPMSSMNPVLQHVLRSESRIALRHRLSRRCACLRSLSMSTRSSSDRDSAPPSRPIGWRMRGGRSSSWSAAAATRREASPEIPTR